MGVQRSERTWVIGAAVLGLLVAAVGWFLFISPQRAQTADVESRTADAQTQNLTLQGRINALTADSKNRSKYSAALSAARQALPTSGNLSSFLRVAQSTAAATGTHITSLNVGDPEAFTPLPVGAPAPSASAAPSGSPSGSPNAGADSGAASGTSGLFDIPIDASVVGKPGALSGFLTTLQSRQPRAVLVTSVSRSIADNGNAVLQLSMKIFVAAAPGAAPASGPPTGG